MFGRRIHKGRPNLSNEVESLSVHGVKGAVSVCGPSSLVHSLADLTRDFGVSFIAESFEF